MAQPTHSKTSDRKTKDLLALTTVPLIMVLGNSMLIPVLPQMKAALNISPFQVSLTITLFSLSAGLIIPLAGFLSDRFNRKAVIIPAILLYGGGGLLAGIAAVSFKDPYLWIIVGRTVQGLGAAGTAPIAMALLGDLFKGGAQSKALGLAESANGMGKVISPIAGSLLGLIAWWAPFFAFPVLCALSAFMIWRLVREPEAKERPSTVREYVRSLATIFRREGRWLAGAFFAGSSCLFVLFGVLFYLSDWLETKYRLDGVIKGGVLAIPLLGMVLTAYITGAVIKKKGRLMKRLIGPHLAGGKSRDGDRRGKPLFLHRPHHRRRRRHRRRLALSEQFHHRRRPQSGTGHDHVHLRQRPLFGRRRRTPGLQLAHGHLPHRHAGIGGRSHRLGGAAGFLAHSSDENRQREHGAWAPTAPALRPSAEPPGPGKGADVKKVIRKELSRHGRTTPFSLLNQRRPFMPAVS